ncbi:MAG: hypothetical protein U5K74_11725 [Gemmatimonadaceae bacterium]|nr:hypothetical protein [Gemmatimonadaceae bacterium]
MSTAVTADRDEGAPLLDSATNARIAREDAALEAGLPPPPPTAPRR